MRKEGLDRCSAIAYVEKSSENDAVLVFICHYKDHRRARMTIHSKFAKQMYEITQFHRISDVYLHTSMQSRSFHGYA